MSDKKWVEEDVPLILEAVQKARERKEPGTVTISFGKDGGVLSIEVTAKLKLK